MSFLQSQLFIQFNRVGNSRQVASERLAVCSIVWTLHQREVSSKVGDYLGIAFNDVFFTHKLIYFLLLHSQRTTAIFVGSPAAIQNWIGPNPPDPIMEMKDLAVAVNISSLARRRIEFTGQLEIKTSWWLRVTNQHSLNKLYSGAEYMNNS